MLTFPKDLVSVGSLTWKLAVPGDDALSSIAGQPQQVFRSGGPCWQATLENLMMRGRTAILAGKRLQAALANGQPIEVRACDCRHIAGPGVTASFTADAALRATTVAISSSGGRALREGDHFSPTHTHWGLRMYRLIRDNGDGTWQIRPPLRQAVTNGQAIDFNDPGCTMRPVNLSLQRGFRPSTSIQTGQVDLVELERPTS